MVVYSALTEPSRRINHPGTILDRFRGPEGSTENLVCDLILARFRWDGKGDVLDALEAHHVRDLAWIAKNGEQAFIEAAEKKGYSAASLPARKQRVPHGEETVTHGPVD